MVAPIIPQGEAIRRTRVDCFTAFAKTLAVV
jgi:hypothetical protein